MFEHWQRCWRRIIGGFIGCHVVDLKIEVETLFVIVKAIARRMERVLSRLLEIMQSELSKATSVVEKFPPR